MATKAEPTQSGDLSTSEDGTKKKKGHANDTLKLKPVPPLSIKDYDYKAPKQIESPRSLKAMEFLVLNMTHIMPKNVHFYQEKAATKEDLDRLIKKEHRGIECLVRQIREKRAELIKAETFAQEMSLKHQTEKEHKMRMLQQQAEEAERIRKEIEQQTVQKIEKKLQKREEKLKKAKETDSPHYDQYFNLKYVPKPKEYFSVIAKSQSIKQQMDLSKAKLELLKEKQLKEMGHMLEYEMNSQHIKKRNEELQKQRADSLKYFENFKNHRFKEHMEVLTYKEQKLKEQKLLDEAIRRENKERMMKIKYRETEEKMMKLQAIEDKARFIKESEANFEQNRKYMVKQMLSDFKDLKKGGSQAEDIALKYGPLMRDEEALVRALDDLNRRRMASKGEKDNLNSRALIASASMGRMQSASVAQMTRVGSAQSNMQLPPDFLNTEADEWAEQRKLLKKRQNHQMMELVHKISSEESNQKQLLEECKNDEERIKLRQKFIEKKIANQKVVKAMMATHHKESEYLEARARGDPLDGEKKDGEGEEEQTAGEEEENEGEPEEVMA